MTLPGVLKLTRIRRGIYLSGEWRITHARLEENYYLPLWTCARLNGDGDRYVLAESFDTLAEAKAYVAGMPGAEVR